MKQVFLFLLLLTLVFAGSFAGSKWLAQRTPHPVAIALPSFNLPSSFTLQNHPFTVVIVGANNGATVAKTLSSVFSQTYENYRVIYIDDASDEGSFELARDLIYESGHLGQVTLVRNEKKLGLLANLFRAVKECPDEEIIVVLGGEDWLAHEWVLQRLNAYYADPDVWITYGQYRDFPTYQLGICRETKETDLRHQPFMASHLKTFYAALFKKVRESDFVFGGKFLPTCAEMAAMIPMLEMAKEHSQFVPEVLYIHNRQTAGKEDREQQLRCEKFVRTLTPYSPLERLLCGG